jgi:hypothetical protein
MTDLKSFQSLASELIFPNIQIHCSNEADKVVCNFAASIASAQKIMSRNQGFSMHNDGKRGHSKYQKNGPEKST